MREMFGDLESWLSMLERIAENSTNMIVVTNAQKRIVWVNQTYSRITGWTLDDCRGKSPSEFLHGRLTNRVAISRIRQLLQDGVSVSDVEVVNYRKSGETYVVQLNIEPIRSEDGSIAAYLSIQSDVSERKQLEARESQLRRHLEVAQRLARLGRIEYDAGAARATWSGQVYRILELPDDGVERGIQDLFEFLVEADKARVASLLADALEHGIEFDAELRVNDRQGRIKWVRCRGVPEQHGDGYTLPSTWTVQDITVYKSLIEERRRRNEELEWQVGERTRELEEAGRAMEEFAYALSHDLKKPIRHMVSYAQLLQESVNERAGDVNDYVERIVGAGKVANELIEAMLNMARLRAEGVVRSRVCLDGLVREVIADLGTDDSVAHVRWRVLDGLPHVMGDGVLLRDVWINLIDNAVKFSRGRGPVEVEIGAQPLVQGCVVYIRDSGWGFDPADAERIFGLFQRGAPPKGVSGTGIGLAYVRRVVETHGWQIAAQGARGQGAEFRITIPTLCLASD